MGYSLLGRRELGRTLLILAAIWLVFGLDLFLPLERFGLFPRKTAGLPGVAFMPFLHGSLAHLIGNTIPLVILLLLLSGSRANHSIIVAFVAILSGGLLWLFGRPVIHIGASGLVFGLIGFLIFSGVFEKRILAALVSIIVRFLYGGSLIAGVMPGQTGISWDGHICGVAAGIAVAWLAARK